MDKESSESYEGGFEEEEEKDIKKMFKDFVMKVKREKVFKGIASDALPISDDDQVEYLKYQVDKLEQLWRSNFKKPFLSSERSDLFLRKMGCICCLVSAIAFMVVAVLTVFIVEYVNFFTEPAKTSIDFEILEFPKDYPQIVICDYLGEGDLNNEGLISGLQFYHVDELTIGEVEYIENKMFYVNEIGLDEPREVNCLVYNTDRELIQENAAESTFISFYIIANESDYMTVSPRLFVIDHDTVNLADENEFDEPNNDAIIGHGVYDVVIQEEQYIVKKRSFLSMRTDSDDTVYSPRSNGVPIGINGYAATDSCFGGLCYLLVVLLAKYSTQKMVATEFYDRVWYTPFISAGGVMGTLKILLTLVIFCDTFVCFRIICLGRKCSGHNLEKEISLDYEAFVELLETRRKKKKKEEEMKKKKGKETLSSDESTEESEEESEEVEDESQGDFELKEVPRSIEDVFEEEEGESSEEEEEAYGSIDEKDLSNVEVEE